MKNKSLIRKYYFVMSVCIVLIPISFILLNYMFLFIHTTLFSMLNVDKKFSSSFLYVNFYLFYFLLLFIFVIIGAKFFKIQSKESPRWIIHLKKLFTKIFIQIKLKYQRIARMKSTYSLKLSIN